MNFKIGFPERSDIQKLVELDYMVFDKDLTLDTSDVEKWHDINNYQWLAAKDEEGNALGYLGIFHINEEAYYKLVKGEITEKDLNNKYFLKLCESNDIYCYIDGFVVKEKNTRIAMSLLIKSIGYVKFLKEKNISIQKIVTMATSKTGINLCNKLGFKKIREYKVLPDGIIPTLFELDLKDESFSRLVNAIKEVIYENDTYL